MTLFFQSSALSFYKRDFILAGVGPHLYLIENEKIIRKFSFFDNNMRIIFIKIVDDQIFTFAENLLIIFSLSNDFDVEKLFKIQYPDIIKTVDYSTKSDTIITIHGHAQIGKVNKKDIIENSLNQNIINLQNPKNWKLCTAATVAGNDIFYADSFGTLTYYDNFEQETMYGAIFDIKKNKTNNQVLTAHENHAVVLWNLRNDGMEPIWVDNGFSSRVWGCDFFHGEPISYAEDGCIHYKNHLFMLHRSKSIVSMAIKDDTVITSGQYGTIRFSNFSDIEAKENIFDQINQPTTVASLENGKCIAGYKNGLLSIIPDNVTIYDPIDYNGKNGWFLISTFQNSVLAFSQNNKLLYFNISDNKSAIIKSNFKFMASTISLNNNIATVLFVNRNLSVFSLPNLELLNDFDLSNDLNSSSCASSISFLNNEEKMSQTPKAFIIAIGHLNNILILEFNLLKKEITRKTSLNSHVSDGFLSLHFINNTLYCAGHSNGTVSIIKQIDNDWKLKGYWKVPHQNKAIIEITGDNSLIVSILAKDSIKFWDLATQTMVGSVKFNGNKNRVSIASSKERLTISHCKSNQIILISSPYLSTNFFGSPFHGLRILSSTISSQQNPSKNFLITGSCDRDIRLWDVDNNEFKFLDCAFGSTDGTHCLCCFNNIIISGGAKKSLYSWKIIDSNLILIKDFQLDQYGIQTKVDFRISCCALTSHNYLIFGTSDAFINIFKFNYLNDSCYIELIKREPTKGVPVSISEYEDKIVIVESTGYLMFLDNLDALQHFNEHKIANCGVMMVRLFKANNTFISVSSCDDGNLIFTNLNNFTEITKIYTSHSGGIRSVAVRPINDNCIFVATFSYDQQIFLYTIHFPDISDISIKKYETTVFDGERVEIINDKIIALGSGMEIFSI